VLLPSTGLNWPSVKTHERRLDDDIKADLKIRRSFAERLLLSQDRISPLTDSIGNEIKLAPRIII